MSTGWQPVPGWYPDPGGLHEWRWWDGTRWADTISDAGVTANDELDDPTGAAQFPPGPARAPGAPPPPPPPGGAYRADGKSSTAEKWNFVFYLVLFLVTAALTGGDALFVVVIVIGFAVATRFVGYRLRDTLMLLIPFFNAYLVVVFLWRFACYRRHYWAEAPEF